MQREKIEHCFVISVITPNLDINSILWEVVTYIRQVCLVVYEEYFNNSNNKGLY